MECKPIFSDDRGIRLEHYGVKGMKWHQHLFSSLEEAASQLEKGSASDSQYKKTLKKLLSYGVKRALDSSAVTKGRYEVNKLLYSSEKATELMKKGDNLSDSERAALRNKAKAEKKERTRQRQEAAKKAGNPLWMFM